MDCVELGREEAGERVGRMVDCRQGPEVTRGKDCIGYEDEGDGNTLPAHGKIDCIMFATRLALYLSANEYFCLFVFQYFDHSNPSG